MEKSIDQTVEERRAYVNQVRQSFQAQENSSHNNIHTSNWNFYAEEEEEMKTPSTLGIRTVIAILIFAAFVYCDQEGISFHQYKTEEVFSQIEWNPLPIEDIVETLAQ